MTVAKRVNEVLRPTYQYKRSNGDFYAFRLMFTKYPNPTLSLVFYENRQKIAEIPIRNLNEFIEAIDQAYEIMLEEFGEEALEDTYESRNEEEEEETESERRSYRRSSGGYGGSRSSSGRWSKSSKSSSKSRSKSSSRSSGRRSKGRIRRD